MNLVIIMIKQKYDRVYNFSAGPSMLPLEVLEQVKEKYPEYEIKAGLDTDYNEI